MPEALKCHPALILGTSAWHRHVRGCCAGASTVSIELAQAVRATVTPVVCAAPCRTVRRVASGHQASVRRLAGGMRAAAFDWPVKDPDVSASQTLARPRTARGPTRSWSCQAPPGSIAALYDHEQFESSHGRQPGSLKALALGREELAKKRKAEPE